MQRSLRILTLAAAALAALVPAVASGELRWKRVGGTGVAAGFAGEAGSPAHGAWFSADGGQLLVALRSGKHWASGDLGRTWKPAEDGLVAAAGARGGSSGSWEPSVVRNPYRAGVAYALGEHLYRTDDGGGEWVNLTAIGGESLIGRWQAALAISSRDPSLIVVANSRGLWKSHDEGVTWSSLNATLPNFPEARFLPVRSASVPALSSRELGTLELIRTSAGPIWRATGPPNPAANPLPPIDAARSSMHPESLPSGYAVSHRVWRGGQPISGDLTDCSEGPRCRSRSITAFAAGGRLWAGTSNGRIWLSDDDGQTWRLSWTNPEEEAVTGLWTDPDLPLTALATAGGRVLRSTNGGTSWLDISSDLPSAPWRAVRGHPAAGTVYVAGPAGVYFSRADLEIPGPAGPWTPIRGDMPALATADLAIDTSRGRLYALVPGFGVYWTRTPQVDQALRVLSAADLRERPVAPGSLLTVIGASAVSAMAGGHPAPIMDRDRGRTQLQVPFAIGGRSVRLRLTEPGSVRTVEMAVEEVSPAIFVVAGEPLVLDAGTGALVGWSRPAAPGGTVLVMATGLGKVAPPWPAGVAAPVSDPPRPVARVQATIDGLPAPVLAAHLAPGFAGMYVVEVAIPHRSNPGTAQLAISADDRASNLVSLVVGR